MYRIFVVSQEKFNFASIFEKIELVSKNYVSFSRTEKTAYLSANFSRKKKHKDRILQKIPTKSLEWKKVNFEN